jgi:hypothetical protein
VVLDIRTRADPNLLDVATYHRSVEDARISTDLDVPDHSRPGRNPDARVQSRFDLAVGAKDRADSSINHVSLSRFAQTSISSDPS